MYTERQPAHRACGDANRNDMTPADERRALCRDDHNRVEEGIQGTYPAMVLRMTIEQDNSMIFSLPPSLSLQAMFDACGGLCCHPVCRRYTTFITETVDITFDPKRGLAMDKSTRFADFDGVREAVGATQPSPFCYQVRAHSPTSLHTSRELWPQHI